MNDYMVEDKLAGRFFWEEVCSVFESRLPYKYNNNNEINIIFIN